MHTLPWFSTFTLFTEIGVTAALLYVFYRGYRYNSFPFRVAALTLAYEIVFNMSYMSYRALTHIDPPEHPHSSFHVAVAAFHGIFSLLMFVLLLWFMFVAWRNYRNGVNYFRLRPRLTSVFLIAWLTAVGSGFFFYYLAYFSQA
jgi:hypothetical protein